MKNTFKGLDKTEANRILEMHKAVINEQFEGLTDKERYRIEEDISFGDFGYEMERYLYGLHEVLRDYLYGKFSQDEAIAKLDLVAKNIPAAEIINEFTEMVQDDIRYMRDRTGHLKNAPDKIGGGHDDSITSLENAPNKIDDFGINENSDTPKFKEDMYTIPHEDIDDLFIVKGGPKNRYNFIRKLGEKYVSYSDLFRINGPKVISGDSIEEVLMKIK